MCGVKREIKKKTEKAMRVHWHVYNIDDWFGLVAGTRASYVQYIYINVKQKKETYIK